MTDSLLLVGDESDKPANRPPVELVLSAVEGAPSVSADTLLSVLLSTGISFSSVIRAG